MRPVSLLLTVAPPGPVLELIWPLFAALGLLGLWAGERRRRALAAGLLVLVAALGAELHAEYRRDTAELTPEWRQAHVALGLGLLLAGAGVWRARRGLSARPARGGRPGAAGDGGSAA